MRSIEEDFEAKARRLIPEFDVSSSQSRYRSALILAITAPSEKDMEMAMILASELESGLTSEEITIAKKEVEYYFDSRRRNRRRRYWRPRRSGSPEPSDL